MDYKKLNDYELVYQIRENDEVAYNILIRKYSNLVNMLARKALRKFKYLRLEYEDLYQEGMLGIVKALNDYNSSETLFYTYALVCAKREMEKMIKGQLRKKRMVLNDAISINGCIDNNPDLVLEDLIPAKYNLEEEYENYDTYERVMKSRFDFELMDSSILELRVNGFSSKEIAILLDLTYRVVDYRLRKIRKTLLKIS